jgi:PIN domain nuclease of toxin-antitoxin system
MNLLVDTHTLIWWITNNPRLGRKAVDLIFSSRTVVWVSAVSIWEISIKAALRRAGTEHTFYDVLPSELDRQGFRPLPISFEHALAVRELPPLHKDPFDRMLVAQAKCEDLTLLTADSALAAYRIRTMDALA